MNGQVNNNVNELPKYAQDAINSDPLPEGQRHEDIVNTSYKLVGEGLSNEEIFSILKEKYPSKPDSEIYRTIDGAIRKGPKPATASRRSGRANFGRSGITKGDDGKLAVRRLKLSENPNLETVPKEECTIAEFLDRIFEPGETVCLGLEFTYWDEEGRWTPRNSGSFGTIERFKEILKSGLNPFDPKAGAYIRINPIKKDNYSGDDSSVSAFRHVLVEFDSRTKLEQWHVYKESRLPIACVIDSGGKSLHAWIKVDAVNLEQYKERQEMVYEYLADYMDDKGNKNPARFSRLPGVQRGDQQQHVAAFDVGAKSWEEWESSNLDDGLPESLDLAELFEEEIIEPKHIAQNFARKGQVGSFTGPSKSRKSWTAMEFALSVSQGGSFLKWGCYSGNVFYVDTELEKYDFQQRMKAIAKDKGFSNLENGKITPLLLRGVQMSIEQLVPALIKRLKGKGYDLIVIDSIYTLLGDREENSNENITELGSWLHKLAKELDVAVVFTHHFSKGQKVGVRGIEKSSGAGAWGRFVDVSLAIDQHATEEGCFNFEPDLRTFEHQSPFVARQTGSIWKIETGLKVEHKTGSNKGELTDILDILVNECGGECSPGEFDQMCVERLSISKATAERRRRKAIKDGLAEQIGKTSKTVFKIKRGVIKNDETGRYEPPSARVKLSSASADEPF
jgi:RecA-family ATPase